MIMSGKKRPGAKRGVEIFGHGPGDAQAIEGARATSDFIEDDQAARGGVVQDIGRLVHLNHKGALAASEIVARADAGENAVKQPDHRAPWPGTKQPQWASNVIRATCRM